MLMWVSSDGCIEKLFYLRKYDTEVKSKLAKANELELHGASNRFSIPQ